MSIRQIGPDHMACKDPDCSSAEFWVTADDARVICSDDECFAEYGRLAEAADSAGVALIQAERARQIAVKGYGEAHDAEHSGGELAAAGAAYAAHAAGYDDDARGLWPFGLLNFKAGTKPLDDLVKAGALIAAELDRLIAAEAAR